MAIQCDIIPATGTPYFTTNIEDGVALADESLRAAFAAAYPDAWARIQARRRFMIGHARHRPASRRAAIFQSGRIPPTTSLEGRHGDDHRCLRRCANRTSSTEPLSPTRAAETESHWGWRCDVLKFDGATKQFGGLVALDACTFAAQPGRLTGFLGPNGAGKTTAMRAVFGLVELDAGAVRWRGAPIGRAERARFGYMPEERGLYPRMRVRDQLVYLGRLCGRTSRRRESERRHLARATRPRRPSERPPRRALARQPAAGPAHRRAGQRARAARARRAVLRARSARHRQHVRAARRGRGGGRDGAVLQPPARPGRGPLRRRRHHRPRPHRPRRRPRPSCGPRCRNGSSTSATAARHPTGRRWPSVGARRVERTARPACASTATPISPRWSRSLGATDDLVSFTYQPPTLSELFRQAVAA